MKSISDGDASVVKYAIEDAIRYNRLIVSGETVPYSAEQPEEVRIAAGKVRLFESLRIRLARKGERVPEERNENDLCCCGHRYSDHRMICDCGTGAGDCGHAAGDWDTACFHQENGKYCDCGRFSAPGNPQNIEEPASEGQSE